MKLHQTSSAIASLDVSKKTTGRESWRKKWSAFVGVIAGALFAFTSTAQIIVVDSDTSKVFSVPAGATSYAWTLDGAAVGGNSSSFTYSPQVQDVGTHFLAVNQILSGGAVSNSYWGVRVRIPMPVAAVNYYVATNGSDANAGTIGSPFLTLEKARDTVRALARPLAAGGVTVWLRGGTYFRTATLMLTNANDSGTTVAPVVYRGYSNETVVISAGKAIDASAFVALNSSQTNRVAPGVNPASILEMDVAAAGLTHAVAFPTKFGQFTTYNTYSTNSDGGICELFYNGQRMYLSRYPNHDLVNDDLNTTNMAMDGVAVTGPGSTNYLNTAGTYTNSSGTAVSVGCAFLCKSNDVARFTRWQSALANGGLWVQGYWRVPWQIDALKVLAFDAPNRVVEINSAATPSGGIGSKYARPAGNKAEPFWVLNLLEEMDQPGEWAIDYNRNKIYFYAPGAIANGSVVISDLGTPIIQISDQNNIAFQSLQFEAGLAQGIYVTNGWRNLVLDCTFRNMNGPAADFNDGGTNGVVSCDISEMANLGIFLRGGYETNNPALRVPARDFVVNNVITNFGRVTRIYEAAVDAGFGGPVGGSGGGGHIESVGMRVAHNRIGGGPHGGVLHGSWDHTFEYNDVSAYCNVSDDLGGFYCYDNYGRFGNSTFRYNFVHDSPHGDGFYFDNDHPQMHLYGNIVNLRMLSAEPRGYGYLYKIGSETSATNTQTLDCHDNLAVNDRFSYQIFAASNSIIEDNAAILSINTNYTWTLVYTNSGGGVSQVASSAAVLASGTNMTYTNDIGFLDLANNDMRLDPATAIYSDLPNFAPIPFEMIGLYNDEYRSDARGFSPLVATSNAVSITYNSATVNGRLFYPQFESNTVVKVYYGTSDGGTTFASWQNVASLGIQTAGPVSAGLGSLNSSTIYYYRFYATNAFGNDWSPASQFFATPAPPPPAAPTGLNAAAENTQVLLSWNSSATATSYNVKRATVNGGPYTTITNVSNSAFANTGLANGTTYYYVVSALNTGGESADSAQVSAAPSSLQGPLVNRATGGTATANQQGSNTNETPAKAFDGLTSTKWYSGSASAGPWWLQYDFGAGNAWIVVRYDVSSANDVPARDPKDWQFQGSSDGTNWTTLDTRSSQMFGARFQNSAYAVNNSTAYRWYRLYVTANSGGSGYGLQLSELALYGEDLPSPWATADIGAVAANGSATYNNALFTIIGSGADIWGTVDEFRYVYQTASGDCSISAFVTGVQNTQGSAKAGVMIRETLATNSIYAGIYVTPASGVKMETRATTGASATSTAVKSGITAPYWVKLTRTGNTFVGFGSTNGSTWTPVGTNTITMASNPYFGLPVCSHLDGTLCTGTFTNVVASP